MNSRLARLAIFLLVLPGFLACASLRSREPAPLQFREAPSPHGEDLFPNWPLPPDEVAELLATAEREQRSEEGAGAGVTGAMKATYYFPTRDVEITVKWKEMPEDDLDGVNNAPRKELAVYEIQKLFLDPEDYVVPTSVARCAPLERYRHFHPEAEPNVPGTNCVCGVLSVWLQDVTVPDELYEEERFCSDPSYAYFLSNFNLLTYLVAHKDGRDGNFLVSKDEKRRQVFAVDNGISFGGFIQNWFVRNWDIIRVPALRRDSIDRLRKIRREDLDALAVLVQFEADAAGVLRQVPPAPCLDPDTGARVRGGTVQLGLTQAEIDDVYERIRALIERVDSGSLPVF